MYWLILCKSLDALCTLLICIFFSSIVPLSAPNIVITPADNRSCSEDRAEITAKTKTIRQRSDSLQVFGGDHAFCVNDFLMVLGFKDTHLYSIPHANTEVGSALVKILSIELLAITVVLFQPQNSHLNIWLVKPSQLSIVVTDVQQVYLDSSNMLTLIHLTCDQCLAYLP